MAKAFRSAARVAIFGALSGALPGVQVFDHVPFEPEGAPTANFPFATIGEADATPFDNDTKLGAYVETTVHVWSRYKGRKEVDEILDQIYALLHRANLSATGYRFVDCLFEFSDVMTEADGQTRHGVIRFRITMQEE